jgi:hypothetical protein
MKFLKYALLFFVSFNSEHLNAQLNFICDCETQNVNELYCMLENAGYKPVSAIIETDSPYNTNCPCDDVLMLKNEDGSESIIENPIQNSQTNVEINGHDFILEDVFDYYSSHLGLSTNINIYNLSEFCTNIDIVLNGPSNDADFNLNIVLIDQQGDDCDLIYFKTVFNDPCGFGFIYIDRTTFPIPDYNKGLLKSGDNIYYSYIENNFNISSSPPNLTYTLLENTTSIVLEMNSYISQSYDGPPAPWQICGEKLISYIEIIPTYNIVTGTYVYNLDSQYKVGATGGFPFLEGRHYFENLPNIELSETQIQNFNGCFEQHVSVPDFEEFALYVLGYDIVNVAQKAQLVIEGNEFHLKFSTDIFPSCDFVLYGEGPFFGAGQTSRKLEIYDQPSFHETHSFITELRCLHPLPCTIINTSNRPDPMFYCRFPQ